MKLSRVANLKKIGVSLPKGPHRRSSDEVDAKAEGVPEPPSPSPTDPRLPLSAKQKFNILKSWKGIARAIEPTGVEMFIRLFQQNSSLISLFEKFQSLKTVEMQASSLELREHAAIVMRILNEAINSLDNIDAFFDFLYRVGQTHRKIPGFRKEFFWHMERPFLEAVKQTLEDRYTEHMDVIYRITIKFILETLVKGYSLCSSPTGEGSACFAVNSLLSAGARELPSKLQELQIGEDAASGDEGSCRSRTPWTSPPGCR